jgi:hypothetical protein
MTSIHQLDFVDPEVGQSVRAKPKRVTARLQWLKPHYLATLRHNLARHARSQKNENTTNCKQKTLFTTGFTQLLKVATISKLKTYTDLPIAFSLL